MKEVTLLGKGPSWTECPFKEMETWGTLSVLDIEGLQDKRFDKLFVFDRLTPLLRKALAVATLRDIPIVSTLQYATEKYPLEKIGLQMRSSYLKPTMSHMIAYALYLGYDSLNIYGIDQGPAWNHANGKPYIMHWLGIATGLKVNYKLGVGSMKWAYKVGYDMRLHPEVVSC